MDGIYHLLSLIEKVGTFDQSALLKGTLEKYLPFAD
jgi:hypothetical protein